MIDDLLRDRRAREALARLGPDASGDETLARAAWSVITEPGDGIAGALIAALGPAEALRAGLESGAGAVNGTAAQIIHALRPDNAQRAFADAQARWRPRAGVPGVVDALEAAGAVGARVVTPESALWPIGLDDLDAHAPALLWVRGDPAVLAARRAVSMVGARMATGYGEQVTAELAGDLAAQDVLIVSGGAYGIDGAAHRAALGVGGTTIAYLAGGIDRPYPSGHRQLFDRILHSGGAVISEAPCGTTPTKWRFLARNRLIAAAAGAVVVVEAGWRSGSLNTAGHAATLGRPLGAVPGPITSPASAGCHRLMREYDARCVTSAAEVRELLGEDPAMSATVDDRRDSDTVRLLDAMSMRTAHPAEELARRAGLGRDRVRAILGRLELEGTARRHDEGWLAIATR